jgi:hypothetical protein
VSTVTILPRLASLGKILKADNSNFVVFDFYLMPIRLLEIILSSKDLTKPHATRRQLSRDTTFWCQSNPYVVMEVILPTMHC